MGRYEVAIVMKVGMNTRRKSKITVAFTFPFKCLSICFHPRRKRRMNKITEIGDGIPAGGEQVRFEEQASPARGWWANVAQPGG